jgi:hypothetical protein
MLVYYCQDIKEEFFSMYGLWATPRLSIQRVFTKVESNVFTKAQDKGSLVKQMAYGSGQLGRERVESDEIRASYGEKGEGIGSS